MKQVLIAALLALLLYPSTAQAYPTEVKVKKLEWIEDFERWKAKARERWQAARAAAAAEAAQEAAAEEAAAVVVPSAPPVAQGSVADIIYSVFGSYGSQAVSVASCESGLSPTAVNGQYFGIFQMGEWERATYGGGSSTDPWVQTRAAYAYFQASGSDWSPWACKP